MPASGAVVIGSQSRFVLQPREEAVDVFYLLDISNNQSVPVNPPAPFAFDMPDGATGTAIMDGSSPQASVKGTPRRRCRAVRAGPHLRAGRRVAAGRGRLDRDRAEAAGQPRRAGGHRQEVGDTTLKSPQLKEQREMPADGEMFIAGDRRRGGRRPAD